jgi:hypothetical protein
VQTKLDRSSVLLLGWFNGLHSEAVNALSEGSKLLIDQPVLRCNARFSGEEEKGGEGARQGRGKSVGDE